MKTILLVLTGGTIGSSNDAGTIRPSEQAPDQLLQMFRMRFPHYRDQRFHTLAPIQILSENLNPAAWTVLIEAIEAQQPDRFDGIIITHGTDTLAFSAAALSLYFNAITIPVLLVSSDLPLDRPDANGLDNFNCAVEFIVNQRLPGIFVPYRNQGQKQHVHAAVRLTSSLQLSGDFFSVQGKSFMAFQDGEFIPLHPIPERSLDGFPLMPRFASNILLIRPYPGLNYRQFDLSGVNVVLHDLYHSGTACTTEAWGSEYSLIEFIVHCRKRGIKVFLAPSLNTGKAYETTRGLIESGAEMLWNLTLEVAYVKLLLAYGNMDDERKIIEFLHSDRAGEHLC